MFKLNKFDFKKYLGMLLLIICITLATVFSYLPFGSISTYAASAAEHEKNVSNDLLDSPNFKTTASSYPDKKPSGWTMIDDEDSDVINEDGIKHGIVNLHSDHFLPSELETSNPGSYNGNTETDTKDEYYTNLMINSYNGAGKLGYRSDKFPLDENSYYKVTVLLLTQENAQASIYVDGLLDEDNLDEKPYFEMINTDGLWTNYTFYIDTNESQTDLTMELWLGSRSDTSNGSLFVNKVTITRYCEDEYTHNVDLELASRDNNLNTNTRIISYSPEQDLNPVLNSSFEDNNKLNSTWSKVAASSTNNSLNQYSEIVELSNFNKFSVIGLNSNCSPDNRFALLMYNANATCYQTIQSSKITIQPREYYKLTLWAWTDDADTSAYVTLVDKTEGLEGDELAEDTTLKVSDFTTENIYRGNWKKYTFCISGHATDVREIAINLSLGLKDEAVKGYIFFDDIRLENITSTQYSDNSESDTSKNLAFSVDNEDFLVDNSLFNLVEDVDGYDINQPTGWIHSNSNNASSNIIYSGVINTTSTDFESNKALYGGSHSYLINPGPTPMSNANNNVLMMGNHAENITQTYKSSDFTLSNGTSYRVSFYVYTNYYKDVAKQNTGFRASIVNNDTSAPIYNHYNITHDKVWHLYEVYIKVATSDISAHIEFNFEQAQGYVFIDNVVCTKLEADDDDINVFDKHHSYNDNNTEIILDYSYETFETGVFNKDGSATTSMVSWTGKSSNDVTPTNAGILDTANKNIENEFVGIAIPTPKTGNNLLYIRSLHDVYYTFTSKQQFTFTAENYFKISVLIATENIDTDTTDNDYISQLGASIKLTDATSGIVYEGINNATLNKTGFVEYVIYVCLSEELVSTIELSLGSENTTTKGVVYFDSLIVTSLASKADYEADKENRLAGTFKEYINYAPLEDDETSTSNEFVNDFNWLTIPSIITAVAILIAVVGFYVKKINIKTTPKIKTSYDRRKTLDKSIDRKEKIALRKQIIEELNKELADIKKELEDFKTLSDKKIEELKEKLTAEKESINKHKFELEIRRKEYVAEREKSLKANPELIKDKKAEKEFTQYIAKLDRQEVQLQKSLVAKDTTLEQEISKQETYIKSFTERQQIIIDEIAKIEEEIAQIQREEEIMWDEYTEAKKKIKEKKIKDGSTKSKKK